MDEVEKFAAEVRANVRGLRADGDVQALSRIWVREVTRYGYSRNFTWMGRPIVQCPQDLMAMQEIIWRVKPDLVIETGIAHGGSLVFYASMLELLGGGGHVLGIDIDIRAHNRALIEAHPMSRRIRMIQGSSTDEEVVEQARRHARGKSAVLVVLDSDHTHAHVLRELELYSPLVRCGSYLVVFDTLLEDLPDDLVRDRRWRKGDNPKTAVRAFLPRSDRFIVDDEIPAKLLITVAPDGYLRCVKD